VALDQGSGAPSLPVVAAGDLVRLGSLVARPGAPDSVSLHSPVSGRVRAIERRALAHGDGLCIVIENDGSDRLDRTVRPVEWSALEGPELLERLREAGIAGLGGAAFPAGAKLAAARAAGVSMLLLNGAECEPWICCDDALMRERATDVVLGAQVMLAASGADACVVAIEDDKPEAVATMTAAVDAAGDARIAVSALPAVYPLGAERQLIDVVTGREVPHDRLPPAIGVVCQNVGTAAAVARWVRTGWPAITRILTVTGSGVAEPANVEARIGTTVAELVAACGGYCDEPLSLIAGGAMTGRALGTDAVPVTKGLACVVAATAADLSPRGPERPCIRCGDCSAACPAYLLPQQLHRAALVDDEAGFARFGLADCIECGCCDYVCPSRIPLVERFRDAKARRLERDHDRRRAEEARARHDRHQRRLAAEAEAERRAFDEARRRVRPGDPG
jgi:electron transport complex protein RnfC